MYHIGPGGEHKYHTIKQRKNTVNQHNHKLSSAWALWRWSPCHGRLRGVFLANHLASNDNLQPKHRIHTISLSLRFIGHFPGEPGL